MTGTLAWLTALFLMGSGSSHVTAVPYTLIVCGAGGEEAYQKQFSDWGRRLRTALIDRYGHDPDTLVLLTEAGDEDGVTASSTRETILSRLRELGVCSKPEDQFALYLIGHGSYRRRVAKLNVRGPDLSAEDLSLTLKGVRAERVIVFNTASASAPFVNALSGRNRIVCTSTRSRDQVNATRFAKSFIQALEDGSADLNRDDRISVWEAARQAASITSVWYDSQKLIAPEHAILDDNGDGLGTRLFVDETAATSSADGELAKRTYLKDIRFPDHIPKAWVREYRAAIGRVEAWIAQKAETDTSTYLKRLESLLLEAAMANRRIRGAGSGGGMEHMRPGMNPQPQTGEAPVGG